MRIKIDDVRNQQVINLLEEHLRHMYETTPAESVHALDLEALRAPDITFWCAWEDQSLMGCGALKVLTPTSGEIKSMRTASQHLRQGVASHILKTILDEARARNYQALFLETGANSDFKAARNLYQQFGFTNVGPFANYKEDPNSTFMRCQFAEIPEN